MVQELILVRGLPGSGKSALATQLFPEAVILEANDYFWTDGIFRFIPSKVKDAHRWCIKTTEKAIKEGKSVVVTNTFARRWEIIQYLDMVRRHKLPLRIIRATGACRNTHNVPEESLAELKKRFEDIEGEEFH